MSIRGVMGRSLAAGCLVLASLSGFAAPSTPVAEFRGSPPPRTMRVIVEFHGTPSSRATAPQASAHDELFERFRADLPGPAAQKSGATAAAPMIRHEFRTVLLGAAVEIHPGSLERLRRLPYVARVTPEVEMRVSPSDPVVLSDTIDARARVNAIPLGTGGEGIVVAVIDTGIDYRHPALGGGFGPGYKVAGGYDFVNGDDDPLDDHGHGTHVAGTVAANALGLLGVAPDATLLAYKVLSAAGSGGESDIIAAIERALDPNGDGDRSDRAHVINLSLGGPGDAEDPVSRAVDAAVAAGVVVVVAAGNDGRTSTIGSPGTAVDAITVAAVDDQRAVTSFSSRGPSPRLLGFKPDIAAPGYQIASTWLDERVVSINGTSMASPHVAGVAALLMKLHPDWDPAMVKAALTSGATNVSDHPFARGAGSVDADAAHRVELVRDQSGLSFGIRTSGIGTTEASQTIRLTNRSAGSQSLSIQAGSTPAGIAITIVPAVLEIPGGQTREVSVQLRTTNELLAYPEDLIITGDLVVSGSSSMTIPWGFLRSTRATINYDEFATVIHAVDRDGGREQTTRTSRSAEFLLPPGRTWDFIIIGYDMPASEGPFEVRRTVVRENVAITGDHVIDVHSSEATLEIVLDPRDQRAMPLRERPAGTAAPLHLVGTRMFREEDETLFSWIFVERAEEVGKTFYSPLSDRYSLNHFEQYFDHDTFEWYTIEHDVLTGLERSRTLTAGGTGLTHAKVHWNRPPLRKDHLDVCSYDALTTPRIRYWVAGCFPTAPAERSHLDAYLSQEQSMLGHAGLIVRSGTIMSQALRSREGAIVISADPIPGPVAARVAPGGDYHLGAGLVYPFEIPGTTTALWSGFPSPGFYGASGEMIAEDGGTRWSSFDAAGSQTASGIWRGVYSGSNPPAPSPNARLVAERRQIEGFGRISSGVLDVRFGSDQADLTAPTLTSLRVVDGAGRTAGTVARGEQAMLQFSIADSDFARAGETKPSRPEMTRAWARAGGGEWKPLSVVITGSETGSLISLRHFPAGDIYSAGLAPVTGTDGRWIDIRLEFEDAAGNRVSWTHEMALAVGDPSQPRRRTVGR